ncbi:protein kinase family protein [Aliarcobacter cryaerophilus]|uniref:protein kinase family protein n=1 Tax=Aliarcobacter cryaerophilus TaxID=28198 RepID=UPI000825E058|nr:protein kinase family protein [Aliarcobacter cryaerophilus]
MSQISLQMVDKNNLAPYKNIKVNNINYIFGHQIAKGHFSTIYKATDSWSNNLVVKIYDSRINEKLFENEIKQLKNFASKNVVTLYEAFSYEKYHFLIMENFGVSVSRIKTDDFNTKKEIFIECAKSLLQSLHNIHKQGYIHGDINPQNLLISIENNKILGVKLCDFTFCRKYDFIDKDYVGLANWIYPPEYYSLGVEKLSSSMDIYHTALVLYSILNEEKITYTKEEVLSNKPQIDVLNSKIPIVNALSKALQIDSNKRPTALEFWETIVKNNNKS